LIPCISAQSFVKISAADSRWCRHSVSVGKILRAHGGKIPSPRESQNSVRREVRADSRGGRGFCQENGLNVNLVSNLSTVLVKDNSQTLKTVH